MVPNRALLAAFALFALLAAPLHAQSVNGPPEVRAAGPGELIEAKGTGKRAEVLTFEEELAPRLLATRIGETLRVAGWPVAPGRRADVLLKRRDVYAPDAKIWKVGREGATEVPRSRVAFLWGKAEGDPAIRVLAIADPDSGELRGFSITPEGAHEMRPLPAKAADATVRHLVAPPEVFLDDQAQAVDVDWSCGQGDVSHALLQEIAASSTEPIFDAAISSLHTATIAVETDNELLSLKFGDNTTSASNYLAELFATLNVIYERDLLIRLLQGTTYLRVSSQPDPYTTTSFDSTVTKLYEFRDEWSANQGGVTRALAMMLSGKQSSNYSSSGIAWVDSLCSKTYGYSFSQVFKYPGSTGASDGLVVGHELGHNFGSPHTHCYDPPIDNCYNGQATSGCYSDTQSCPAPQTINGVTNVTGTLMSYCHLSGISGCTSSRVFHPRTMDLLDGYIQNRVGACIFPYQNPNPTLTAVTPNNGTTAGNTLVTLTGTGLQSGATVAFGGTAATSVTVVNSTTITARTPARATGRVNVVVTNPDATTATLVNGYFYAPPPSETDFYTVTPCRVIDTRQASLGAPAFSANQSRTFAIAGSCGIPAGARSIAVNLTAVDPAANGNFQLYPGNGIPLGTSSLNFRAGMTLANNAVVLLATDGTGTLGVRSSSSGSVDFLLDVVGYFQ